jgi:uncharacterized membrane protein YdbT with pleckstrin-like domain
MFLAIFDLIITCHFHAPWYWFILGLCSLLLGVFGAAMFGIAVLVAFHAPWWIWIIWLILLILSADND